MQIGIYCNIQEYYMAYCNIHTYLEYICFRIHPNFLNHETRNHRKVVTVRTPFECSLKSLFTFLIMKVQSKGRNGSSLFIKSDNWLGYQHAEMTCSTLKLSNNTYAIRHHGYCSLGQGNLATCNIRRYHRSNTYDFL